MSTMTAAKPEQSAAVMSAVVHGMHPMRGYPVTLHLTPLPVLPGHPATFRVESVDGEIDDDVVWSLAEHDESVMTAPEALELVHRVTAH